MRQVILRRKSDAGNPHVRLDEGKIASAKPGRGSLLGTTQVLQRVLRVGLLLAAVSGLGRAQAQMGGNDAAAAPSVLNSAIFWLDAADSSTLTLENGNVIEWKSKTSDQRTATWRGTKPVYDTTTWGIPTVDVVSSENCALTYAPNATVTVDVGNRKVRSGERLLAWNAIPEGVTFIPVSSANYALRTKDEGLFVVRGLFIRVR